MKKQNWIVTLTVLLMLACGLMSQAQSGYWGSYSVKPQLTFLDLGETNSFTVDVTKSTGFALEASFAGVGAHTTTADIGVVATPAAGDTLGLLVGGAWTVYEWATNPVQKAPVYSRPGTNVSIQFLTGTTNGATVSVTLNAATHLFTFTNSPAASTDVLTNTTAEGTATNFYNAAAVYWPTPAISVSGDTVTIASGAGGAWKIENVEGLSTSTEAAYFTVTNQVDVNSHQLKLGDNAEDAANNLLKALQKDWYPASLAVSVSGSVVSLAALGNATFTLTNSETWATNNVVTNDIAGGLTFSASNSLDGMTWTADADKDFTVLYDSTNPVTVRSNWTGLGAVGYWKFTVGNASTNYAVPAGLQIKSAVKTGL